MNLVEALILGIVEGLTEFLPVSSTGHLTIAEGLLGLPVDDPGITAFTAVIQVGAIAAVLVYFAGDIYRIARAWLVGLAKPEHRGTLDHRLGWYVIVGSLPIPVVALLAEGAIKGPLRSLWVVAVALVVWSFVMIAAERFGSQERSLKQTRLKDALIIGLVQCIALVPGVSRSGATISAGLFLGIDRVTATKLSFYLSIPALTAAGLYELPSALANNVGVGPLVVGTVTSFVVAYAAIAWLLRFVASNSIGWFAPYRIILGLTLAGLLATSVLSPT